MVITKTFTWFRAQGAAVRLLFKQWILRVALPNFHAVSPKLFRGGQPTKRGYRRLKKMGIKSVINLRSDKSEVEGVKVFNFPLSMTERPDEESIKEILEIIDEPKNQPVFLHCLFGADRTGFFCALYRMAREKWSREKAIREMKKSRFGYHYWLKCLPNYLEHVKIQGLFYG